MPVRFDPSAFAHWFDDFDLEVHDLIVFLQLISGWAPGFATNDAELPDLMLFIWGSTGHEIATMPSRASSPFQVRVQSLSSWCCSLVLFLASTCEQLALRYFLFLTSNASFTGRRKRASAVVGPLCKHLLRDFES